MSKPHTGRRRGAAPNATSPTALADTERIAALLGTVDPTQQAERLESILRRTSIPPLSIMITVDPIRGSTNIALSREATYDEAKLVLQTATEQLVRQQVEQEKQTKDAEAVNALAGTMADNIGQVHAGS